MTVAETLSTGQNAERPGGNRGELKLNQSALGSARDEARGVPHLAHALGRINRGVP
jgi:hypothetical protein